MDVYGSSDFGIDDLLDFSNDELFSSSSSSADTSSIDHRNNNLPSITANISSQQTFFAADLCFPSDNDVAELEWLSRFVGDENDSDMSFFAGASAGSESCTQNDASFSNRSARGKRSPSSPSGWIAGAGKSSARPKRLSPAEESPATMRRCSHCLSEKTPQWRTGPMGPKTLCNACGVRFKSGRLVPEYRPAASPTFVLTQHSNSHRKVMELRRQKELSRQPSSAEQQNQQGQFYSHHQQHGFRVC